MRLILPRARQAATGPVRSGQVRSGPVRSGHAHGAVQIIARSSPTHCLESRLVRFLRLHRATLCCADFRVIPEGCRPDPAGFSGPYSSPRLYRACLLARFARYVYRYVCQFASTCLASAAQERPRGGLAVRISVSHRASPAPTNCSPPPAASCSVPPAQQPPPALPASPPPQPAIRASLLLLLRFTSFLSIRAR